MPQKRKGNLTKIREEFAKLADVWYGMLIENTQKERAVSIDDVLWNLYVEIIREKPTAYVHGFYMEDSKMFAVISDEGKLYRAAIKFKKDGAVIGEEWFEVEMKFESTERSSDADISTAQLVAEQRKPSTYTIWRNKDGRYRWISVSCSAVLNRSGSIDSRDLMDSFIESIEKGADYPYRDFYHLGEQYRTGQADFIAREGYLLVTSGLYDEDNELAEMEIAARQRNPEYWGDSIEFVTSEKADKIEVMEGVEIDIYNHGVLMAISTLPEENAAALFTGHTELEEVTRMNDREFAALVKMYDGDEEKAQAFIDGITPTNREIVEDGYVARSTDELEAEAETEKPAESDETEEEDVEAETESEDEDVTELVIDDADLPALREALFEDPRIQALFEVPALIVAIAGEMDTLTQTLAERDESITHLMDAMEGLERSEDAKKKEWSDDIGTRARNILQVSYRAKENAKTEETDETEQEDPHEKTNAHVKGILEKVPEY